MRPVPAPATAPTVSARALQAAIVPAKMTAPTKSLRIILLLIGIRRFDRATPDAEVFYTLYLF
jgi:hypothetical protein